MTARPTVRVVAALIYDELGRVLVTQRPAGKSRAGQWEFPGGKIEAGETPEAALTRELREELGIEATVGRQIDTYEFAYPGKNPILLIFLRVEEWEGEVQNRIFDRIEWARGRELAGYDFLEGDLRFLATITSGE